MCSSPLKIVNPSTFLSPSHGQKLFLSVPCGKCLECRENYQNEWRLRLFYEFMDCINSNGYVLFDTLTYNNFHLPRLSDMFNVPKELDFACFRSHDIKLFLKRLRNNLKKLGYDPKDNLRYFVVSEYGTDQRYTHRPHYHVFMFVRHNFVPFNILSYQISRSWSIYNEIDKSFSPIGITDGLPYKSFSYVRQHNTFFDMNQNARRVALYLAKYVSKDFAYMDLVDKRLNSINEHLSAVGFTSRKNFCSEVKLMKQFVVPFHRQSLNFGQLLYQDRDIDDIIDNGIKFYIDGLPLFYPVFPNIKRKLFYRYYRDSLGVVHWKKTALGLKRDLHYLARQSRFFDYRVRSYNDNNVDKLNLGFIDSFNQFRLLSRPCKSLSDCCDVLKSEYLVDVKNGYRNYSCHGFDFCNSKVFALVDYGLRKHKYFRPRHFSFVDDIKVKDKIYPFAVLNEKCLYDRKIDDQLKKLYSYTLNRGNRKLAVSRHLERNLNILKQLNLC